MENEIGKIENEVMVCVMSRCRCDWFRGIIDIRFEFDFYFIILLKF